MKSISGLTVVMTISLTAFAVACTAEGTVQQSGAGARTKPLPALGADPGVATFAGGCFWCMEPPFEKLPGVSAVISGYMGGHDEKPTYEAVCKGETGHAEVVQVRYDPAKIAYADLLQVFWRQIDPTDAGGQFVDRGNQYRSEIFVHSERQRETAEASKRQLEKSDRFAKPVVTAITPAPKFYKAEAYHQDFYEKDPNRYYSYRRGSGRDKFLDRVWGQDRKFQPKTPATRYSKPPRAELRKRLTKLQYRVTQEDGTEPPFRNEYWDNKRAGIYVDIVSGEPLFSSRDKFKSGTGWPSFTRPLEPTHIREATDHKLGYARTEVRSTHGDSHLGHVFPDGPAPTGLRYCINSAALRFVPKDELASSGYPEYAKLFEEKAKPTSREK